MSLSSAMLNAGAGLLPDPPASVGTAIQLPTVLNQAITTYESIPVVQQFAEIMTAAANLMILTGTISDTEVIYGGTGYDPAALPTVQFLPVPGGAFASGALATAQVTGSLLSAINISDPGRGYETLPEIFLIGGAGTGASAIAFRRLEVGPLSNSTFNDIVTLGSGVFPALTNVLPQTYTAADVYFEYPLPSWQSSSVYAANSEVSFLMLPEFGIDFFYTSGQQVQFGGIAYQAKVNTIGNFPGDEDYWETVDIAPINYSAVLQNQGRLPYTGQTWITTTGTYRLTSTILDDASAVLGSGDLTKFTQVFQSAAGYLGQSNQIINSTNSTEILNATFDPATGGMTTITTGSVNQFTSNIASTAADLANIGKIWNMQNLDDIGLPGELVAQLARVTNGLPGTVADLLQASGLSTQKIDQLSSGVNDLSTTEEKLVYQALQAVTGNILQQVLVLFAVRTRGISNMAQLLDPKHLFPYSYLNFTCPTANTIQTVYLAGGAVNSQLRSTVENLSVTSFTGPNNVNGLNTLELIIPPDQALATKSIIFALKQIKGIDQSTLPQFAAALAAVSTNQGLDLVESQSEVVPQTIIDLYKQDLGNSSQTNGTISLDDVIGVVVDQDIVTGLTDSANLISAIDVTTLSAIFSNMLSLLEGSFGDPYGPITIPSGPGAGSYSDLEDALQTMLPLASAEVSALAAGNADTVSQTNTVWQSITEKLARQKNNLTKCNIIFSSLENNVTSSVLSFTAALHEFGINPQTNDFLEQVANSACLSGQSVIASLREGRNIAALEAAGIILDTQLPGN